MLNSSGPSTDPCIGTLYIICYIYNLLLNEEPTTDAVINKFQCILIKTISMQFGNK